MTISSETISTIKELTELGFSVRHISSKLNIADSEVKKIIIENNFALLLEKFKPDSKSTVMKLYFDGVSASNLGKKFQIGKRKILRWAKEEGAVRSKSESIRKHQINPYIFDFLDGGEKAYWLGFLFGHGHLAKKYVSLSLPVVKKSHLEKFVVFLGADQRMIKTVTSGLYVYVNLRDLRLIQSLVKLGFQDAVFDLEKLSKDLRSYFVLGFIDARMVLTKKKNDQWKWTLSGKEGMLDGIQKFFLQEDISILKDPSTKSPSLYVFGNLKIKRILDVAYKSMVVSMDENYSKYLEILKSYKEIHKKDIVTHRDFFKVNGLDMTTSNLKNASLEERESLVDGIVEEIMRVGFVYLDDQNLLEQYQNLVALETDLNQLKLNNQQKMGNNICKHFCKSFFHVKSRDDKSVFDMYKNKEIIEKVVRNKLLQEDRTSYNFSPATIVDEIKGSRLCACPSLFKPTIAKYICEKYSKPGDLVGDYSAGFGGRLLGAMASGRKYIGTDPLTAPELQNMIDHFNFKDCKVIQMGSEFYRGEKGSVDLYWSSPPYYDLEIYSDALSQAYNKGEVYFFNKYWRGTLENVKWMLKSGGWFGVNIPDKLEKMLDICQEYFGKIEEEIVLTSSVFNNKEKNEKIYMFKNK